MQCAVTGIMRWYNVLDVYVKCKLLERSSSDLSTVFNLQAAHRELVHLFCQCVR